ncbi:zinc ABC transporter substrate-binding protein [Pontivivens insulae]|uniref:High-affinity zinc uptake system protein ZnuA n=1 Tax=Pontivivens insulae TaxID=1639689 RepID=A0A2R8AA40_9RHOB|nr:zinc ABC transporter substrate-binding protein [Pontivivens insulae]RED12986.1 zinc transport system substrate-binding protein [Pontivivens insulae]SPF29079.1 High-affinity zinc uptake system protein ZnuA [Pontivivens insulae]
MFRYLPVMTLTALPAAADVPNVVTDILPVHSLVSQVMEGVGAPAVLVDGEASPHSFSLRPSQAVALQEADLVLWIGEGLTPWLADPLEALAGNAHHVALLDLAGTRVLEARDLEDFAEAGHDETEEHGHDEHAHDEHGHDGHGHDDHEEHAHEDDAHDNHGHDDHDAHGHDDHDDHDDDHAGHEGHDHGPNDPHAWLAPDNAVYWLGAIAAELSELDPDNAALYQANATAAITEIEAATASIRSQVATVSEQDYLVFHDAYQYFEDTFGISARAVLAIGDATPPGPAQINEIQNVVRAENIVCAFAEPQFSSRMVDTVIEGTEVRTAVLDPIGSAQAEGGALYLGMLNDLANALVECLSEDG